MENAATIPNSIVNSNCSSLPHDTQGCFKLTDILNSLFDGKTEHISNYSGRGAPPLKPPSLISDELTYILEIIIIVVGLSLTSIFGLCANTVNMIVYGKQGLKDSITVGLFALSLSDLVLVTMPLITAACHAADYILPESPIDFPSLHYVSSGWVRNMMYSMSCLITAFLSLERCCCIILPFKVKSIFTRGKTAFTLSLFFLFHLGCVMMLPAAYELTWWPSRSYSVSKNMSRIFRVVFFEEGETIEVFNTTVLSLVIPTVTQVVVTVCIVVMIQGLQTSAKFRQSAAASQSAGKITALENRSISKAEYNIHNADMSCTNNNPDLNAKECNKSTPASKARPSNTLSSRDARLVKTMIFLVTIQSACNIPFLAATFAWRSVPELNIGMVYENTLRVVFSCVYLLGNLNASCNVFVYYYTGSTFKAVLRTMYCFRPKQKE